MSPVGEAFWSVVLCYVVLQGIMYQPRGEAFRYVIYCVDINMLYVILACKMHSVNLLSCSVDCVVLTQTSVLVCNMPSLLTQTFYHLPWPVRMLCSVL